jgi:hypothetical protein
VQLTTAAFSPLAANFQTPLRLRNVGNPDMQPSYPMARPTLTVEASGCTWSAPMATWHASEAASGRALWRKNLRRDFGGQPGTWAYAESPLIVGDVLVATPGGKEATLVALYRKTRRAHLEVAGARWIVIPYFRLSRPIAKSRPRPRALAR